MASTTVRSLPPRSLESLYPPVPGHHWFEGAAECRFDVSAALARPANRWWLCEHALLAYSDAEEVRNVLQPWYGSISPAQDAASSGFAYLARATDYAVLAFRGTEVFRPGDPCPKLRAVLADWVNDAALARSIWQGPGTAHRGFVLAFEALWRSVGRALETLPDGLPLYCCGHSLGGALAVLAALRLHARGPCRPLHVLTLGQPAVGDAACVAPLAALDYIRLVHSRDLITRLPPAWMGYRHAGTEVRLATAPAQPGGGIRPGVGRRWSRWLAALTPDVLVDHAPLHYCVAAWNAALAPAGQGPTFEAQERQTPPVGGVC